MAEDKITVVIAVYNAVSYLQRSVDSVLNQSFQNLEIILIDDGSTDGSGALCDSLSEKDSRVIVIHKENEGLSVARNVALKQASGNFISFIDSDDELRQDAYERSIHILKDTNADFLKYDYCIDKKDFYSKQAICAVLEPANQVVDKILCDEYGSQLWQYLFKKELWDGIISPPGRLAQDMMTLHIAASRAKQTAILHENLYYYFRSRADNVSNSNKKKVRGTSDRAYAYWLRYAFCKENHAHRNMSDFCLSKAVDYTVSCFCRQDFLHDERYEQDRVAFLSNLKAYESQIADNKQIGKIKKICTKIVCMRPQLLCRMYIFCRREKKR